MADEEHFVDAIRANPADDVPRLIYADWLEEQGDPRAEFIRVQCALAKLDPWDDERWALEDREHELRKQYWRKWFGPVEKLGIRLGGTEEKGVTCVRGMPAVVTLPGVTLRKKGADLFSLYPTLRDVRLTTTASGVGMINSPLFPHLHGFELSRLKLRARDMPTIATKGKQLRRLSLKYVDIGPVGVKKFAESLKLSHLQHLTLWADFQGSNHYQLAERLGPSLRSLDLRGSYDRFSLGKFFHSLANPSLDTIALHAGNLERADTNAFADAPNLRTLRLERIGGVHGNSRFFESLRGVELQHLTLAGGQFTDADVSAIAKLKLQSLKTLDLSDNHLTENALKSLASMTGLENLRSLSLNRNTLDGDNVGQWLVAVLENCPQLRALDLSATEMSAASLKVLFNSPAAGQLVSLRLARALREKPEAVLSLANSVHLGQLRQLDLSHNELTTDAISAIASSQSLGLLRELKLFDHQRAENDWLPLLRSPLMKGLRSLNLFTGSPSVSNQQLLEELPADVQLHKLGVHLSDNEFGDLLKLPWMQQLAELEVRYAGGSTGDVTKHFGKWAEKNLVNLRHD